eukprot:143286_1
MSLSFFHQNQDLWPYNAFVQELLVYGFIRRIRSLFHPKNIIHLTFKYTQLLSPSFFIHLNTYYGGQPPAPPIEISGVDIEISNDMTSEFYNKHGRMVVPDNEKDIQWCKSSKFLTHHLEYIFTIKCIKNMFNKHVYIGIRNFEPGEYWCSHYQRHGTAYAMSVVSMTNNVCTVVFYELNGDRLFFDLDDHHYRHEKMLSTITIDIDKNREHDIISLILNCNEWRLYFILNSQIIHSIKVEKDKECIPIIFTNHEIEIKYQITEMKCNIIKSSTKQPKGVAIRQNIDKYVFTVWKYNYLLRQKCVNHSQQIVNLLWTGKYRLIYINGDIKKFVVNRFHKEGNYLIITIFTIYQWFFMKYNTFIQEELAHKHRFNNMDDGELSTISNIISNYVHDNYSDCMDNLLNEDWKWSMDEYCYRYQFRTIKDVNKFEYKSKYNNRDLMNDIRINLKEFGGFRFFDNKSWFSGDNYTYLFAYRRPYDGSNWSCDTWTDIEDDDHYNDKLNESLLVRNSNYRNQGRNQYYKIKKYKHWNNSRKRTKKRYKKQSYNKRKNDKKGNVISNEKYKKRYIPPGSIFNIIVCVCCLV